MILKLNECILTGDGHYNDNYNDNYNNIWSDVCKSVERELDSEPVYKVNL